MDDDKLKDLFRDFQPELSSSDLFMSRLQKSMEAVEFVKRHDRALRRRTRAAVAIAALCGFAMGVICTLLLPLICDWVSTLSISLPHLRISSFTIDYSTLAYIAIATVCVITTLNAYEIALAKLTTRVDHTM